MSFFKKLFGGNEMIPWENIPRNGRTYIEEQREQLEQPGTLQINHFEVCITPEEIADKLCSWDVPTLFMADGQPCCFLKLRSLSEHMMGPLTDSISSGKVTLKPAFKSFPTYPVVSLLFQVSTPARTVNLEAVPDVTTADVQDSLDNLLKLGSGVFFLFVSDPPRLLAKGQFIVSVQSLRRCLDQASTHYKGINPSALNYSAAVQQYFQST